MRFLRGGSLRDALARGPLPLDGPRRPRTRSARRSPPRTGRASSTATSSRPTSSSTRTATPTSRTSASRATSRAARTPEGARRAAYYISPEETAGEEPTARADVYSLGLVLSRCSPAAPARRHAATGAPCRRSTRCTVGATARPRPRSGGALRRRRARSSPRSPRSAGAAAEAGPARNPYKGLRPFVEPDAPDFLGRESLVARLVERLAAGRLLALVGPSGSGKSSAVRAGLVPAVRAASRRALVRRRDGARRRSVRRARGGARAARAGRAAARPRRADRARRRRAPAAAAGCCPATDSELLLVVDQFEELFTLVADEERRAASWRRCAPRRPTRAAASASCSRSAPTSSTGRSPTPASPRSCARAPSSSCRSAPTSSSARSPGRPRARRRGRGGPARRAGGRRRRPARRAAAAAVHARRALRPARRRQLTLAGYRELGGVAGAVARGAEEVYARSTRPGGTRRGSSSCASSSRDGGRRRVLRSELLAGRGRRRHRRVRPPPAAVLRPRPRDARADRRDRPRRAAEAWDRLRAGSTTPRDDLRTQRQLAAAAREWLDAGRDPSFLLRGARLERLESWRAADRRADAAGARVPRRLGRGARPARRARACAASGTLAAAAARRRRRWPAWRRSRPRCLAVFAFDQRSDAERERRTAVARELASAAVADLDDDAERSVLLALAAVERARPPTAPSRPRRARRCTARSSPRGSCCACRAWAARWTGARTARCS